MRYALLADIHGNLEALRAVLTHLERCGGARLAVAGDLVGYGPDPSAVIALLRERGALCVAGNHEGMVLGRVGFERCVYRGIRAALWTRRHLNSLELQWLAALPSTRLLSGEVALCHGDLDDCQRYITSAPRARDALHKLDPLYPSANVLVCGHTHKQLYYVADEGFGAPPVGVAVQVPRGQRCLVNPGSVGQSRDERAVARYAIYDVTEGSLRFYELEYDVQRTSEKMRRTGLVPELARVPRSSLGRRLDRLKTRAARWAASRLPPPELGTPYQPETGEEDPSRHGRRQEA